MRQALFIAALAVFAGSPSAFPNAENETCAEAGKNTACFENAKEVDGRTLPLRGARLFEYWKFDLYTAAFYAPAEAKGIDGVLADVPKSLVLHYHRRIRPEDMNRAAKHALQKNTAVDLEKLSLRLAQMESVYEPVDKGDRYELRYQPGKGTTLLFNGQEKLTLPGNDFASAYFGIWLGHYPLNAALRDTLLGGVETAGNPSRQT